MATLRSATRALPQGFISASTGRLREPCFHTFRGASVYALLIPNTRATYATQAGRKTNNVSQDKKLNQERLGEQEQEFNLDEQIGQAKELQARTPWHREGSDKPPVKRLRRAGAMTKGESHIHTGWRIIISDKLSDQGNS